MLSKRLFHSLLITEIVLLIIVTTITYLPNLLKATIYRDDWYYTVDRMKGGPETFHEMFNIDRPARGYFFEMYYRLFGVEPAPYHMATYAWRLLLGIATFWLFSLIWPKQRQAALLIAILFLIYPGYTRWMEGMEDQPKVVSLFLQVTSYALTLLAMRSPRILPRIALWTASILTGWGYIALIDYAMGMEAFRFLCVFVLVNRDRPLQPFFKKAVATLRAAAPGVLVLGGFLFWRVFIFNNQRPETDIKQQLMTVVENPVSGLSNWLLHLVQSVFNDAVIAWGGYAMPNFFELGEPQILTGLLTALVVMTCVLLGLLWLRKINPEDLEAVDDTTTPVPWQQEAIWIGLLGVIGGVIPVVMANRSVEFGILSHYGLPASLASAVLLVGLLGLISSHRLRLGIVSMVVLIAVLTQYSVSTKAANEEAILGRFWHQLVWRAPGIRDATSILVNYPSVTIGEDVDYVHGPANFIYYPEPVDTLPIRYNIFAIKHYPWTAKEFLAGGKVKDGYRTHYGIIDYGYILVITQPTVDSCVRVIDSQWPWFTFNDPDPIIIVGPHSNIRNVRPNTPPPVVSTTIFGPEPEHTWCYYFEKADLALQQKDWQRVSDFANEAARLNLSPAEPLEWMPFLQAYAQLGDEQGFASTLSKINPNAYNKVQACNVMTNMHKAGYKFSPEIERIIQDKLCPE